MSGLGIRLYTDEDVTSTLADQLRRRGYDAISCNEAGNGNQALPDEWQLTWATRQRRTILVYNIADYIQLDTEWKHQGRSHFGIILAEHEWPIGDLLRRSILHLDTVPPEEQFDIARYVTG